MIRVDSFSCFFAALLLLILPLQWMVAACLAAVFHELCHIGAIYLTGGQVYRLHIGVGGARIQTDFSSPGQELLCALAGPAGSLLLLLLYRKYPRLALCGGVQGFFNLLPVYPRDGGRALSCVLEYWLPEHRESILRWTERAVFAAAVAAGIHFSMKGMPAAMSILLICRPFLRKIPCKPGEIKVQ